jgi:alpha-galactosidase/6-phospho-beta-glucosidase family protein
MDICRATELSPLEVWLVDIDAIALKKMTQFFSHMVKKAKNRNWN